MDNKPAVILVGAGGIGSALFQDLCRFLRHDIDIHLMDGDTVEGRNLQRQMFSVKHSGLNKARCLAETATKALGQNRIYHHGYYLDEPAQLERIGRHYRQVILVGAVDNHPARRVMEAWVKTQGKPTYYVDCANEESHGEVVAVVAYGGQVTGQLRSEMDPSVLTDDTGDPTKTSCTEQLDAGNVQVLYTNRKAAILALELINYYLKGEARVGIVYFRECRTERLKVVNSRGPSQVVCT